MRLRKTLFGCAAIALLVVMSAANAVAGRFELSARDMRARFPAWEITNPFGGVARCELTLEWRMHERRITKVVESLIGFITRAAVGACAAGAAQIQMETLPWHIRYESFAGVLPAITRLNTRIVGMGWNITEPGTVRCLIRTSAAEPGRLAFNREAGGVLTQAILGGEIGTGPECLGGRARMTGASNALTVLERAERITLTLI